MSRPVRERLAELSADVEQVRLAPAAAVRARGRSRSRRRWAGAGAALATAVVAGGFALTSVVGGDPVATLPAAAPSGNCKFPVNLKIPTSLGEVRIQVIGSADQAGKVAGELGDRGFSATGPGWIDPDSDSRGTVAVLRYGPGAIGDATLVKALVGSDTIMKFQPHWEGRAIELVLGSEFRGLVTTTELNQNLVPVDEPTRPPGC